MRNPATVYGWLAEIDHSNQHDLVFRGLAAQANASLRADQVALAAHVFGTIHSFTDASHDPYLIFEGRLLLALEAVSKHSYDRATEFLEDALHQLPDVLPHRAIARWMMGCVYFAAGQASAALSAWDSSLNDLNLLALAPGYLPPERVRGLREQMRVALRQAIDEISRGPAPGTAGVGPSPTPPDTGPGFSGWPVTRPSAGRGEPNPWPPARSLIFSTGSDQIRAGDPMRLGVEAGAHDSLEVEQLLINNQRYSIHALPGAPAASSVRLDRFYTLQVKGDSMNRAGIVSGDYVLLRLQEQASHNDIVAALIIGDDYEATLKRFRIFDSGRRVVLQPESDNSRHQPREFINGQNTEGRYRIFGVVVALLKQISA